MLFSLAYPSFSVFLFGYLFCDDHLLVGADGKHVEGGPDGNNGAA